MEKLFPELLELICVKLISTKNLINMIEVGLCEQNMLDNSLLKKYRKSGLTTIFSMKCFIGKIGSYSRFIGVFGEGWIESFDEEEVRHEKNKSKIKNKFKMKNGDLIWQGVRRPLYHHHIFCDGDFLPITKYEYNIHIEDDINDSIKVIPWKLNCLFVTPITFYFNALLYYYYIKEDFIFYMENDNNFEDEEDFSEFYIDLYFEINVAYAGLKITQLDGSKIVIEEPRDDICFREDDDEKYHLYKIKFLDEKNYYLKWISSERYKDFYH